MRLRVTAAVGAVAAVCTLALGGCSTEARAERKGKEFGEQVCKAKDADSPAEAQRHVDKANDKLADLIRFTGRDVREDVRDIDQQLTQMARGGARSQDVNVIVRSVQDARSSVRGNTLAAYDGMLEALADCD